MSALVEQKDPLTVIQGDALSCLRTLPDASVQTCVTSPPYWSLRDYGLEPLVWDDSEGCDHAWEDGPSKEGFTTKARWQHVVNGRGEDGYKCSERGRLARDKNPEAWGQLKQGEFCKDCGAWRGCLGLEPTPGLYVRHVVDVFREVKRVLRKDGTLWLNLGDSYAGGGNGGGGSFAKDGIRCALPGTDKNKAMRYGNRGVTVKSKWIERGSGRWGGGNAPATGDLKPKDLVGIPWMVAFALRADGWYLRSDIIWSKSNPMPESVTDRPTRAHEYIFLLSKAQRYFYDAAAIEEESTNRASGNKGRKFRGDYGGNPDLANTHQGFAFPYEPNGKRNRRSVWSLPTKPFADAHFATFPPELINPCILAGSPIGGVVIDPFAGSGTTGKVAIELGRRAILIEPKAEYVEMIKKRCQTTIGLPLAI